MKRSEFPYIYEFAQSARTVEYTDCFSVECPGYDTKQSDGELSVMLEFWGMQSATLLASLPGQFWPCVVAPDMVLYMGQIELNCVIKLNLIFWDVTILKFKLHTHAKQNF